MIGYARASIPFVLAAAIAYAGGPPQAPAPRPVDDLEYTLPDESVSIHADAGVTQAKDTVDYGHARLNVPEAWKTTKGAKAIVAVLDTGCDLDHRDLKGRVLEAKDFTGSRSGTADVNGHGTHCAGVIGAAENGVGMVGVAPDCLLLVGKVLGDRGSGSSRMIAGGIDWATNWRGKDGERCHVISMSLGGGKRDDIIKAAVDRALAAGAIVVVAAGNSGNGGVGNPGNVPGVVCVGATDKDDRVANFSSRGKELIVAAPGVNVRSCYPGDRFATMSGTSMATPYVAGVAALYVSDRLARGEAWSGSDFLALASSTAKDLAPAGRDTASGYGLVQPAKLVGAPIPPKPPEPKDPDPKPPTPKPDQIIVELDPSVEIIVGGRKVKRIVLELVAIPQPLPKVGEKK